MPLFMDLLPGEGVEMDRGRITVRVEEKSGRRVRLRLDGPRDVPFTRLDPEEATPRD